MAEETLVVTRRTKRTPKDTQAATTRTRKKPKELETVSSQALLIVNDFMEGMSPKDLAEKYTTSEENIGLIINRHWKTLTNVRETRMLVESQQKNGVYNHRDPVYFALKGMQRAQQMNQAFLDLLSPDSDLVLTDQENLYCWTFVQTGDNLQALELSGLNAGLLKDDSRSNRLGYSQSCYLRGLYLRHKPNIAAYILKLQEEQFLRSPISKKDIQVELLNQLNQLKEDGVGGLGNRREQLRVIELLGKTIGAFADRIQIETIDPSKALDYLESLDEVTAKYVQPTQETLEPAQPTQVPSLPFLDEDE